MEEIPDYTQEDMLDDDVMMVDVGTSVYLWIGSGANREEKEKALETAQKFITAAAEHGDGRDADCPIVQVSAGNEPLLFTQFFPGWDPEFADKNKFVDPYEAKLAAMKKAKGASGGGAADDAPALAFNAPSSPGSSVPLDGDFKDPANNKFSYEELTVVGVVPDGVDPTKKEQYLTDEVFQEKFGMAKDAFNALPGWKKTKAKKDAKLF